MKIIYIYTALLTKGGADRVLTGKANYLAEHGYDVGIVTDSQMGRPPVFPLSSMVKLINLDIDFAREYGHSFPVRIYMYFKLMRQYRFAMKKVIEIETPDIVITTMGRDLDFLTDICGSASIIGEAHTTKKHLRNFHLLEQRGFFYNLLVKYWRYKMDKKVKKLDAIVLLTKEDAKSWSGLTKTVVIPNSLPFNPERQCDLLSKRAIVVGRYNNAKGYEYLVKTWKIVHEKCPDWIVNIYGSGEEKEHVRSLIYDNNLQDTMVMNEPTDNIMEKYLESSICIVSSRYEGFSMVLLEAMACGLPCVSFDCPHGPRNIIHDGEDGFLVDYLNVEKLAQQICVLIRDPNLRRLIGLHAKKNVQRFSREVIMKEWMALFNSIK